MLCLSIQELSLIDLLIIIMNIAIKNKEKK
jgi:hypothetical protein